MLDDNELAAIAPDHMLDGGALDCGSGLVLLIREHMMKVPDGGVLEMRSVEPTVRDDLPPWCRMVGHEFLGALPGSSAKQHRYFVRRGTAAQAAEEQAALAEDMDPGFAVACTRHDIEIDDIELTARARLHDVMAHVGLSDGDPSLAAVDVKLFASTFAAEERVREIWAETVRRSPLAATLAKATVLTTKIAIV